MKSLSQASAKKIQKLPKFQMSQFYWLFSSDVMAVKGLSLTVSVDAKHHVY